MMRLLRWLLLGLMILGAPTATWGCASAFQLSNPVQIADESAIIVWDADHGIEHFIRRAIFQTKAHDFGFLVPSPATPTLQAVGDAGFSRLEQAIQPPVIVRKNWNIIWTSWLLGGRLREGFSAAAGNITDSTTTTSSVQVVAQQRVGSYDATVLAADDAQALHDWLQKHGYDARYDLIAWLKPYIAAHWKITAFKLAKDSSGQSNTLDTSAVRMSFATTRPFFPYREPADARDPEEPHYSRSLRVFFIGPGRMSGTIGQSASASWPGQTEWADTLPQRAELDLELGLRPEQIPANAWLTAFMDKSSPRPGVDDVYFTPAADQSAQLPPPIYQDEDAPINVPVELVGLLSLIVCGLGVWRWRASAGAAVA